MRVAKELLPLGMTHMNVINVMLVHTLVSMQAMQHALTYAHLEPMELLWEGLTCLWHVYFANQAHITLN
jgi:hypothetical protein